MFDVIREREVALVGTSKRTIGVLFLQTFIMMPMLSSCGEQSASTPKTRTTAVEINKKTKSQRSLDLEALTLGPSNTSLVSAISRYMPGGKSSKNWQDYFRAGNSALKQRDYESGEYLLDEAIKLAPDQGVLYLMRGKARSNSIRTNNQAALADLEKAKELGSLSDGGYGYMARIYDFMGKQDKALETLNEGIKRFPKTKDLHHARAAFHLARGEKQKAKEDYDESLKCDPRDADVYLLRAQLYESMGKFEQALKDYDTSATCASRRMWERRTSALKSKAKLLAKLGRHKEALKAIDELSEADKDEEDVHFRGDQFAALKMYDEAIVQYTESISMSPENARASYEARAKVFEKLGKFERAKEDKLAAQKLHDAPAEKTLYKISK